MELKGLIQIIFTNEWQLWLYYYWKSIIIVIIIVIIIIIIIILSLLFLACEVSFDWSNNTFTVNFRQGV